MHYKRVAENKDDNTSTKYEFNKVLDWFNDKRSIGDVENIKEFKKLSGQGKLNYLQNIANEKKM